MAVPAESFPTHPKPWTVEELLAQPEDSGQHLELVDGAVVVSPAPDRRHQRLQLELAIQLRAAVAPGHAVELGINVVLGEGRLLIPDIAVTTTLGAHGLYASDAELAMAIEITSPSSRTYDRVLKRQLYAEAGVPWYVVVDVCGAAPEAVLYGLRGERYEECARSRDGRLALPSPFEGTLDLTGSG